jgi:hypothetical protein
MTDNVDKEQIIANCEQLIRKIKDILSAKIVTTSDGKISEIHVVSTSNRNPKQIVRDIESALIASVGSAVDHKKISVAQINNDDNFVSEARLKVEAIHIKKYRHNNEVAVTLSDGSGNTFKGSSIGTSSMQSQIVTTAIATLEAIQQYLKGVFVFSLDDTIFFKIAGREAVAILVCVIINEQEEHFLGSALVKQGYTEAAVAAVLNSINRKISLLVKET